MLIEYYSVWKANIYNLPSKKFRERFHEESNTESGSRSVVLNQWWFCPHGTFGSVWRHFWLSHLGWSNCSWHLVGRAQGCCWTSCSAQDSHTHKELSGPKCLVPRFLIQCIRIVYRILADSLEKSISDKQWWQSIVSETYEICTEISGGHRKLMRRAVSRGWKLLVQR